MNNPNRLLAALTIAGAAILAQQVQNPAEVRAVPPPGIKISDADREQLTTSLKTLERTIEKISSSPLVTDVRVLSEAVKNALRYDEFFKPEEVTKAKELLEAARARAEDLLNGRANWDTATGLVVRGYVSKIDKSIQPYGLVVPPTYAPRLPHKWRVDAWFHGRNETLSEVNFLWDRMRNPGEFTPEDTIVLHLYGRHNNANKFAGEVDLFEALENVRRHYRIDENRIVVRGFSMGGAACWQFATHFAGDWAAAAPGAGFSETPEFLHIERDPVKPTWYEEKLWHLYNATDYAANLFNLPVVAYNGEIDPQKQAADMMEKAMSAEGLRLERVVGPQTGHRYHPDSKPLINSRIDAIAQRGRDPYPRQIRFTTWTLRYNRMKWITIDALDKHWERARLDADVDTTENSIRIRTENVAAFHVDAGPGAHLVNPAAKITVVINGKSLQVPGPMSDGSLSIALERNSAKNTWSVSGDDSSSQTLRKRHGLQGPIDDAFMDSFIFVKPTGQPMNPGITKWVDAEQTRAIKEWRRHFRGEPQVRNDSEITVEDITDSNLVLWGDPGSNKILARIVDKLPLTWTTSKLAIGTATNLNPATQVPVLIYPNPLNPKRYVVVNSGFTYREFDYLNNAREVPKLPDWAVIDTTTPPGPRFPGNIVAADFFDEYWKPAVATTAPARPKRSAARTTD